MSEEEEEEKKRERKENSEKKSEQLHERDGAVKCNVCQVMLAAETLKRGGPPDQGADHVARSSSPLHGRAPTPPTPSIEGQLAHAGSRGRSAPLHEVGLGERERETARRLESLSVHCVAGSSGSKYRSEITGRTLTLIANMSALKLALLSNFLFRNALSSSSSFVPPVEDASPGGGVGRASECCLLAATERSEEEPELDDVAESLSEAGALSTSFKIGFPYMPDGVIKDGVSGIWYLVYCDDSCRTTVA